VFLRIGYVWLYKGVSHYIGHGKHNVERVAFFLSAFALTFMAFPSMSLLYEYRGHGNRVSLIVKVVGAQWY